MNDGKHAFYAAIAEASVVDLDVWENDDLVEHGRVIVKQLAEKGLRVIPMVMKHRFPINEVGNFRKDYTEVLYCPRCEAQLLPYGFCGALSRVDNKTEICSECGQDEALQQWAGFKLGPTSDWPIPLVSVGSSG